MPGDKVQVLDMKPGDKYFGTGGRDELRRILGAVIAKLCADYESDRVECFSIHWARSDGTGDSHTQVNAAFSQVLLLHLAEAIGGIVNGEETDVEAIDIRTRKR